MRVERITKGRAIKIVADHLRELVYKQRMRHIISAQRIAALVGLCELILILFIFALSAYGWTSLGVVICSMVMGSFVTNMVWLVLMRREMRMSEEEW